MRVYEIEKSKVDFDKTVWDELEDSYVVPEAGLFVDWRRSYKNNGRFWPAILKNITKIFHLIKSENYKNPLLM